jgi:hypothetical protein
MCCAAMLRMHSSILLATPTAKCVTGRCSGWPRATTTMFAMMQSSRCCASERRTPTNEIRVEAISGLANWEPTEALPLLLSELERELGEGDYWMDAFEGAEQVGDPSLVPVLQRIVEDMSEQPEDFEGYWLDSVRDAIAACSGGAASEPEGAKA